MPSWVANNNKFTVTNKMEGTKVKYTGEGGYAHHKEHANKHLKVGEVYTIDQTDVGEWHTDVYLKEVPNQAFNSVHFVNTP